MKSLLFCFFFFTFAFYIEREAPTVCSFIHSVNDLLFKKIMLEKEVACRRVECFAGRESDSGMSPLLIQLCESSIKQEILSYFEDMTLSRILKQNGNLEISSVVNPVAKDEQSPSSFSRRGSVGRKVLEDLINMLPEDCKKNVLKHGKLTGVTGSNLAPFNHSYHVTCEGGMTSIVDSLPCHVLVKQIVVLAKTTLAVRIQPFSESMKSPALNPVLELGGRKKSVSCGLARKKRKRSVGHEIHDECVTQVQLMSTHLVDRMDMKGKKSFTSLRPSSFSMQSVFHPNHPTQLESYTYHMVHFGLLCYALWNAHDSLIHFVRHSADGDMALSSTLPPQSAPKSRLTHVRWPKNIGTLFPSSSYDAILILGLGGNALGSCLDACLPRGVLIDVVEIESSMLDVCIRNGLTPPLTLPVKLIGVNQKKFAETQMDDVRSVRVDVSEASESGWYRRDRLHKNACSSLSSSGDKGRSPRMSYHFYAMDANDFLRGDFVEPPKCHLNACHVEEKDGIKGEAHSSDFQQQFPYQKPETQYNIIFLDCYDPEEGTMMHSASLISLCRHRLTPGGALLINAHLDPHSENLQKIFGKEDVFETIQVLRVSGCTQCIIVCLVGGKDGSTVEKTDSVKGFSKHEDTIPFERFQLSFMRRFANFLNGEMSAIDAEQPLIFDSKWLKKSSAIAGISLPRKGNSFPVIPSIRVWEHNT